MRFLIEEIKEYFPFINLVAILFLLLIDLQNYQTFIIFSNVFGFSLITNSMIKNRYKNNLLCRNSLYALNFINLVNIIGCFFEYENYIRFLFILIIFLTLIITVYKQWTYKTN